MRKIHSALLIPAGALMLAACGGQPTRSGGSQGAVQVGVITAQDESVPALLIAPGTVEPRDRVTLSSQINGFVREVQVHAGDSVVKGQVLVTLDARDADSQKAAALASVDEAQAGLGEARRGLEMAKSMRTAAKASSDLAGATYARYLKLAEARSVAPQELDEMRSRRDGATADLSAKEAMVAAAEDRVRQVEAKIAQANAQSSRVDVYVGWTLVRAPSPGKVVERSVDPGSAIFPGSPLMILESTSRPQVVATLPTADSDHLRNGLEVLVRVPDQPIRTGSGESSAPVVGRIAEIIPLSNPVSHTVQFKVDLPAGFSSVSGSFATVEITAGTRKALLVPSQAVRENGQLTGVFVADGSSRARFRLVKTAGYNRERVELLAGIQPGERIIARLTDQIKDGVPLEIRQ
ncbi:MAG TPA: efflux RND transporter periplasmic adaptor subunit [Acidobacteriota bacterium]|nr:efflux RND transporter periplasmic adaptor subunit [Acidobacteriota bacterium]